MITFKQFINEADDESVGELSDLIKKESQSFLTRAGGLLYRGIHLNGEYGISNTGKYLGKFHANGTDFPVYKVKVRKDRKPLNTNPVVSQAVDNWFDENLGFKARSQGVFAFGESGRDQSRGYGDQALVFPVGKFQYTWSPNVTDLYGELDEFMQYRGRPHPDFLDADGNMDPEKVDAYMKTLKYTKDGLDDAIKTNREIMIGTDEVLVVPFSSYPQVARIKAALDIK